METREYRTIDKSSWGPGEWQQEPDKRQWLDATTRYPCLIVRGPSGALCGYVGVPSEHPAYGKHYDQVDYDQVSPHGGLTFSNHCAKSGDESRMVCHVPDPGESDQVWWLGFDCAHSGDYCPAYASRGTLYPRMEWETYKHLAYVTAEVESLALQLQQYSVAESQQ